MPYRTFGRLLAASVGLLTVTSWALAAHPEFDVRACEPKAAAAGARCGVVYVPENHAKPRGRKIGLNVIVLPATGSANSRWAQYDLEGGPGFAVTDFLEFYASDGAAYRQSSDIVLADMRGTGASNPLRCFGIEEREKRLPLAPMYPPELVAECAAQSSVASDPTQYSTAAAALDIEWVRKALGYERLQLSAISYGTTLAMRYIADHPERVRSAVLYGTVAPRFTPPRFHASAAETALQGLAAQCKADESCHNAFGDLDANIARALQRAGALENATPAVFMEKVRNQLYLPFTRARLPALIARAAEGNFSGFTQGRSGRVFADGLYLAITCAESFGEMDVDAAIDASQSTRFGAYRLERQRAACASWPRAPRDPQLMEQRKSNVPVLFIAGELDPVAPADWTRELAKYFPRGRVASIPHGGHMPDGLSGLDTCLDATVLKFYDTADAQALDLSCFAGMAPPPFGAAP